MPSSPWSENWGIGKDNALLFHIRADLQRFKALTTGHTVVMGRRTLESLPGGRGLPGRRNLVLFDAAGLCRARAPEVVRSLGRGRRRRGRGRLRHRAARQVYRALLARCRARVCDAGLRRRGRGRVFPRSRRCAGAVAVEESGPVQEENGLRFQYVTYRQVGE